MPKGETSGSINKRERVSNLQKAEVLKLQYVKDKSFIGEKFGVSEKYVGEIFRKREKILLDVARNPEGKSAKQPMFELLEQSVLLSIAEMRSNSLSVNRSSIVAAAMHVKGAMLKSTDGMDPKKVQRLNGFKACDSWITAPRQR